MSKIEFNCSDLIYLNPQKYCSPLRKKIGSDLYDFFYDLCDRISSFFNSKKKDFSALDDYFESRRNEASLIERFNKKYSILLDKMGFKKDGKINVCFEQKVFGIPYAGGNHTYFPVSFLLEKKDLPERFYIENLNDPKLSDTNFLKDFHNWVLKYFYINIKNAENKFDPKASKTLLILLNDFEKYDLAKQFVICHELAHCILNHFQYGIRKNFIAKFFETRKNEKQADEQALYALGEKGVTGCKFLFETFAHLPFFMKFADSITHGTLYTRMNRKAHNYLPIRNLQLISEK